MKIDDYTIIKCKNKDELSECAEKLRMLGFIVKLKETDDETEENLFIAINTHDVFTNFSRVTIGSKHNLISFETFSEFFQKQIKEKKESALIIDKNGKVLKVNNIENLQKAVYFNVKKYIKMFGFEKTFFYQDYYVSEEACEKALKRKEIENKLRLLAFQLNGNREISEKEWKDQDTMKYFLFINTDTNNILDDFEITSKNQGSIYCLSQDFRNSAIELIGEEDLKDYLINC